jgi:hypothetical protein
LQYAPDRKRHDASVAHVTDNLWFFRTAFQDCQQLANYSPDMPSPPLLMTSCSCTRFDGQAAIYAAIQFKNTQTSPPAPLEAAPVCALSQRFQFQFPPPSSPQLLLAGIVSATDRLKKLLSARDKKAAILDMAAANEIDVALVQLLQQNIDGALAAKQPDAAAFMTKIRDACSKYVLQTSRGPTEQERVRSALQQEKAQGGANRGKEGDRTSPGGLIMP